MTAAVRRGLTRMQALARIEMREGTSDHITRREVNAAIRWIEIAITGSPPRKMTETDMRRARREIAKLING